MRMFKKKDEYVYGLVDPFTDKIRYIGVSDNPKSRLRAHITTSTNPNTPKTSPRLAEWITDIISKGGKPTIKILARFPPNKVLLAEVSYFKMYKENDLLNKMNLEYPLSFYSERVDELARIRREKKIRVKELSKVFGIAACNISMALCHKQGMSFARFQKIEDYVLSK